MENHSRDRDAERPRPVFVGAGAVVAFGALLGVWIGLAGQPDDQDLVAGSCAAAVAVAVGFAVSQRGRALPSFQLADLGRLAALPAQVVVETGRVFAAAARHAAGRRGGAVGEWSTVAVTVPAGTGSGPAGWRAARRDSVLTALLSASPNTIVADIDADAGTALVHRLVRDRAARPSRPGATGRGRAER